MSSTGTKWTEEEEKRLLEEIKSGIDYTEIASLHNRTRGGILSRLRYIAYKSYLNNISIVDICNITNLTKEEVEDIIKRYKCANEIKSNKHIEKEKITADNIMREINTLKADMAELKKDVKEILTLINSIYEFEEDK